MSDYLPLDLFNQGFGSSLISVIPPGAPLTPSSTVHPSQRGKAPGVKAASGLWHGYNWRKEQHTLQQVKQWQHDGANVGIRAKHFPGVDIDVVDPRLALMIEQFTHETLGRAPVRIGNPPKRLLMYRTPAPFGRVRLWIKRSDLEKPHLIEVLGDGQQYLIHGTHPSGRLYSWDRDLRNVGINGLSYITLEKAQAYLKELAQAVEMAGYTAEFEGDGRLTPERAADQSGLRAPNLDELRDAVERIPNEGDFDERDNWIKMGAAIRAAAGEENEPEAFDVFLDWSMKWEGNANSPGGNDPDHVRDNWRRLGSRSSVGWPWIAEMARQYGYNDAANEFDAVMDGPPSNMAARSAEPPDGGPTYLSDQWLADKIADQQGHRLRFVPLHGKWLVWETSYWRPDPAKRAEEIVNRALMRLAEPLARRTDAAAKERAEGMRQAMQLNSTARASAVKAKMQTNGALALVPSQLDADPWVLNTPGGIVELKTGKVVPPNPDLLCTRTTAVAPDFEMPTPEWNRFLAEATANDTELIGYLQRLAGYALTGVTTEQQFSFIYGPGGNGKGVFINAIEGVMKDYATKSPMETFTENKGDRHETELARLDGIRLVLASETQAGKRWNEAKVKMLTGSERISARFMHQDYFTFDPQFKLLFTGNHKPEIRDIDDAMRRRIHMVPFTVKPKKIDTLLGDKLKAEYPGILAWMIRGALAWQEQGLAPPPVVREATEEYFKDSDPFARWLEEEATEDPEAFTTTAELYARWREWANLNGEHVRSARQLALALDRRRLPRGRHPESRARGFKGITLKSELEAVVS